MWDSWIIGVLFEGTFKDILHKLSISEGLLPVKPMVRTPILLAVLIDLIIFFEFPEVEIAIYTSPILE